MANTKIDSIRLGSGSVYDFDLPRDAQITISSITASTANLSVINSRNMTLSGTLVVKSIYFYDTSPGSSFVTTMGYDQDSHRFSLFVQGEGEQSQIDIYPSNITLSNGISEVKRGSYTYSLPSASGTLALTDDIPSVTKSSYGAILIRQTSGYVTTTPTIEFKTNGEVVYHSSPYYASSDTAFILGYGAHNHNI